MVNIPIKVLTNFSEWFTWTELKEALTKAKETLDLVHLARDRFVKLCFWECFRVLYVVFFFFFFLSFWWLFNVTHSLFWLFTKGKTVHKGDRTHRKDSQSQGTRLHLSFPCPDFSYGDGNHAKRAKKAFDQSGLFLFDLYFPLYCWT